MFFSKPAAKTVETITKSLTSMVDDLRAHAGDHDLKAADKAATIADLGNQVETHRSEATRARSVADRISGLVVA